MTEFNVRDVIKLKRGIEPGNLHRGQMIDDAKFMFTDSMIEWLKDMVYTNQKELFDVRKVNKDKYGKITSLRLLNAPKHSLWPPQAFDLIRTEHKVKPKKFILA